MLWAFCFLEKVIICTSQGVNWSQLTRHSKPIRWGVSLPGSDCSGWRHYILVTFLWPSVTFYGRSNCVTDVLVVWRTWNDDTMCLQRKTPKCFMLILKKKKGILWACLMNLSKIDCVQIHPRNFWNSAAKKKQTKQQNWVSFLLMSIKNNWIWQVHTHRCVTQQLSRARTLPSLPLITPPWFFSHISACQLSFHSKETELLLLLLLFFPINT